MRLRLSREVQSIPFCDEDRYIWIGQRLDPKTGLWEDATQEHDSAAEAELALLRNIFNVVLEPTVEANP